MGTIPTIERVREALRLDPETGVLWRRITLSSRALAGTQAGCLHKASGYRVVCLDGDIYREHVLIWYMLYGEWCPRQIDHEDRGRGNNRPLNLRKASESQQRQNTALRRDNSTGERGVSLHKPTGRYAARLHVEGVMMHLGYFATVAAAAEVARAARLKHYGAFAPSYDHAR